MIRASLKVGPLPFGIGLDEFVAGEMYAITNDVIRKFVHGATAGTVLMFVLMVSGNASDGVS